MAQQIWQQETAGDTESPSKFLTALGQELREKKGVDADLAAILATHLLTAEPTADAVSKAKDAILKLASLRATRSGTEVDNA